MAIELTEEGLFLSGPELELAIESMKLDFAMLTQAQSHADAGGCPNGDSCDTCKGRRKRIKRLTKILSVSKKSGDTKVISKDAEKLIKNLFKENKS